MTDEEKKAWEETVATAKRWSQLRPDMTLHRHGPAILAADAELTALRAEVERLKDANDRLRKEDKRLREVLNGKVNRLALAEKVVEAARIMSEHLHKGDDDRRKKYCLHPVCAALRAYDAPQDATEEDESL